MLKWKKSAAVIVAAMLIQTLPQGFVTAGAESVSKPYDSTVRVFEDFEGYANEGAEGETLFTGTAAAKTYTLGSYLRLTVQGENNKVEIVTDPATNSKAMKLTYSGMGQIIVNNLFKGQNSNYAADVIAKSGCKAKFEHYASHSWLKTFNAIVDWQNWYGIARIIGYGDSLAIAGKDGRLNTFADGMTTTYSHEYLSTEMLYNSKNKDTVITEPNKEVKITGGNTNLPGAQRFELIDASAAIKPNYVGPGDAENPTVIWLDDLYFEIIDFNVKHINVGGFAAEKSPADIPVNAPIEVRFNDDCGDSVLNKDNYSLTDASGNAVDFEIQRADGKNIRILPQKQAMGVKYTFTVKAGIAAAADDNVVVLNNNTVTYTTSESGLIFKGYVEDLRFDDWEDTIVEMKDVANGGGAYTALDGKIRLQRANAADSITIATDLATKSKALRIKRNATGSPETRCLLVLPEAYESGKIVVNLDMRVVEMPDSGSMLSFGSSSSEGSAWINQWKNTIKGGGYWCPKDDISDHWGGSDKYEGKQAGPVMMSIDYTNNTFTGEAYRNYGDSTEQYQQKSWDFGTPSKDNRTENIKYMVLGQVSGSKGDIWYDNIRVAYYDYMNLEVEDISIPDTCAAIDDAITLTFNAEVSDDDLTTEKIGIITEVDGDFVKVDSDIKKDGNKVILTPKEKLNYNASYMVNIPQGLTAKTANVKPTENDYMYSFTTAAKDIGFDKMSAKLSEDKNTVTVSGELYSISGQDTEYQIIAAVYDESGRLVTAARGNSGTLSKNSVADINISLAAGESGKVVKIFAWSGLNDMSPIIGNQELDCGK